MKHYLLFSLILGFAAPAAAQNIPLQDDGKPVVQIKTQESPAHGNPGSITTTYAGGNGYAGNMFDITPKTDLEITGLDFHAQAPFQAMDMDVYLRLGSCRGVGDDPSAWTLLSSQTGILSNGPGGGTPMALAASLQAGETYSIYINNVNFYDTGGIAYTNGDGTNEVYENNDITLEGIYGLAPDFGMVFEPRIWNGTLYYEGDGVAPGPSLDVTALIAGSRSTVTLENGTPGGTAIIGFSMVGDGPISTPYGNILLTPPYQTFARTYDANGAISTPKWVPAGTSGMDVWAHALDVTSGTLTNALKLNIQ